MEESRYLIESVYEILNDLDEDYKPLPKGKMTKQQLKHMWRGVKSSLKGYGDARGTTEGNIALAKAKRHFKRARGIGLEKQKHADLGKNVYQSSSEIKNLRNRLKGLAEDYGINCEDDDYYYNYY